MRNFGQCARARSSYIAGTKRDSCLRARIRRQLVVKFISLCKKRVFFFFYDSILKDRYKDKSPGQLRASSRGNTGGTSVIRNDWAYSGLRYTYDSGFSPIGEFFSEKETVSSYGGNKGVSGISGGEVKFGDIRRNADGEDNSLYFS